MKATKDTHVIESKHAVYTKAFIVLASGWVGFLLIKVLLSLLAETQM